MARSPKSVVPKQSSTAIATVDAELANEVANLKNQIGTASGNKIKINVAGTFSLPDGAELGDEIQIVVLDFYSRNFFYGSKYNPNDIQPPDCYSMGRVIADLKPEPDSPAKQHDTCAGCPLNAFGSGDNGTSKACQNRYWLACLVVDPDNPDAINDPEAPIYTLDLSPSNRRSFESFAATVGRTLNGPPIKAVVTVRAANAGTYAKVTFHDPVPNQHYAQHVARRPETVDMLTRRPDFSSAGAPKQNARQPARRQAGARR